MSYKENRGETRDRSSAVKIAVSGLIAFAVTAVFILVGMFVIDRFNATAQTGLEYWMEKVLAGVATFALMLATANICEEVCKRKDTGFQERMNSIDAHYITVLEHGEVDDLETFLTNLNRANKYRAYLRSVKKRIRLAVFFKKEEKRKELEKLLLASPDEVWEDTRRVRYHKITYSQLFEGAQDVSQNDDDNDLNVHRLRYTLEKLAWKIVTLVAFGAVATDIAFSLVGFDREMVLTLIIKICTLLIAAYSGISFGYSMVERTKVVLRRKTRILSQFRARKDNPEKSSERFNVPIPKDIYVEKVRAAFAAEEAEKANTEKPTEEHAETLHKDVQTAHEHDIIEAEQNAEEPEKKPNFLMVLPEKT